MGYRRRGVNDSWHWCSNCSDWPTAPGYDHLATKPTSGDLCNECQSKEDNGKCVPEGVTPPASATPAAKEDGGEKAIAWLVTGFSVITALIAAVGAAPGTVVDRVLKNEPIGMWVAFTLAVLSIVAAVAAYRWARVRGGLVTLSLVLFAGGVLMLAYLLTAARIESERPTIRAALSTESGLRIEATAKAAGLKSTQQMFVYAWGLRVIKVDETGAPSRTEPELLYISQTGPDRAGVVDLAFQIPVPTGRYFSVGIVPVLAQRGVVPSLERVQNLCPKSQLKFDLPETGDSGDGEEEANQACLVVRVPPVSPRPQLSAELTRSDDGTKILKVTVKASSVASDQWVVVRAIGLGPDIDRPFFAMYDVVLGTDAQGAIDSAFQVEVDPRVTVVCVEAAPVNAVERPRARFVGTGDLKCPERLSNLSSTLRLPVR